MDSNRAKRRSFPKSKLIKSLYRAAKPSSAAQPPYGVESQPSKPKPAGSALGFMIVNQEQVFPQPPPKVAFVVAERNHDSYGRLENFYSGGNGNGDECVDAKAAKYISAVQERFRLERVSSERENFQQIIL